MLCGDECESVCGNVKRRICLGDSFSHFEAMNSLEKALFVLGSELWEEHFGSLLTPVYM